MILSITYIRLKSVWKIFSFMAYTAESVKQLNSSKCIDFKANVSLKHHYTLSLWNNMEELRGFSRNGAHKKAVKNAKKIASEIKILSMEADEFPKWKDAKDWVEKKGKVYRY